MSERRSSGLGGGWRRGPALLALLLPLSACGGGGSAGGEATPDPTPGPEGHLSSAVAEPDVLLLFVSGHSALATDHASYLDDAGDAGPYLTQAVRSALPAGSDVLPLYYRDGAGRGTDGNPGLTGLLADLAYVRDHWFAARIGGLAHSHGCPRLVHALKQSPGVVVDALVLLDGNTYFLNETLHDETGDALSALLAPTTVACRQPTANTLPASAPDDGNAQVAYAYDRMPTHDVIPWNVRRCREVRLVQGTLACSPAQLLALDAHWNVRPDGSVLGLSGRVSPGDTHCSVHLDPSGGVALGTVVAPWFSAALKAPLAAGTFDGGTRFPLRVGDAPRDVATADVTGDGLADVLVLLTATQEVAVLAGSAAPGSVFDETGGFLHAEPPGRAATLGAPTYSALGVSAEQLLVSDFDRDGRIDLAAVAPDDQAVAVLYGNGNGTFGAPVLLTAFLDRPARAQAVDLDLDGYPDLATLGESGTLESMLNRVGGARLWGGRVGHGTLPAAGTGLSLVVEDVDGDGAPEALAGYLEFGGLTGRIVLVPGTPGIAGGPPRTFDIGSARTLRAASGLLPGDLAVLHLNRDVHRDLVYLSDTFGDVGVMLGDGAGGFAAPLRTDGNTMAGPHALAAADLDGRDGLELFQAGGSGVLLTRGGTTGFTGTIEYLAQPLLQSGHAEHVALGDLDGDGRPEVAAVGASYAGVTIIRGQ